MQFSVIQLTFQSLLKFASFIRTHPFITHNIPPRFPLSLQIYKSFNSDKVFIDDQKILTTSIRDSFCFLRVEQSSTSSRQSRYQGTTKNQLIHCFHELTFYVDIKRWLLPSKINTWGVYLSAKIFDDILYWTQISWL